MKLGQRTVVFSTSHPVLVTAAMLVITGALVVLAVLPSVWPQTFSMLQPVKVDTDPENMLSQDEAVRVFHHKMKTALDLEDMVVLGVVNETAPNGVFNVESLGRLYELTEYAKTLTGRAIGEADPRAGVVERNIIAPSTVDNIEQGGLGTVRFEWLMPQPPKTEAEALAVRDKAKAIPFLDDTLVSEDGKALAIYLPITSKDLSHTIYTRLRDKIAEFPESGDRYYITGLPVAEDTFGVEMFIQMAVSAPLAMLVIFLLMLYFFRKLVLVISPMILAMISVLFTMGLLVVTGNTIHIMSSMIPIFIMPISILDSIHILSEFFERYQQFKDRRKTIAHVMDTLFTPMLYTSLTSAAGFASLALTPIPPVMVFGVFVAIGIMVAWVFTITFIPAFVMFIPERSLARFGAVHSDDDEEKARHTLLGRVLARTGHFTYARAGLILVLAIGAVLVAGYGMSRIQINDNPVKWFRPSHPIREADRVLNEHFGGTYMAFLALIPNDQPESVSQYLDGFKARLDERVVRLSDTPQLADAAQALKVVAYRSANQAPDKNALLSTLVAFADAQYDKAEGDVDAWDELTLFLAEEKQRDQIFKRPETLHYIAALQDELQKTGIVGKSNSLTDIVKTVHRELFEGKPEEFRIPESSKAVAQCLLTFESSHRPQDVYHFVTPDYRQSSIWVQLTSGDNKDMSKVVAAIDKFVAQNPPPDALKTEWFGLTYINVVWQEKMVSGMLQSFLGSFAVVMLMMVILFRSGLWGFLSMVPLTITIGLIYGVIGLIGKDYDMPVAVLSSLTLGLAVDFAIHFLSRVRTLYQENPSWQAVHGLMFGEPARAIVRNIVAVAIGFLPLLAAPLVPYNTVGIFMAAILGVSGVGTMLIMPALIKYMERALFPSGAALAMTCRCGTCIVAGVLAAATVALNVQQFLGLDWAKTLLWSGLALVVMAGGCWLLSRREQCLAKAHEEPSVQ